ncbi:SDR family oxidoreductase [Actinokineospora spheciospongiae]|uniref:SDR family oxidoreductase n=1 Tax=Actinokineospora spheciospongiae TaxID=909613 RepID=UPI000D71398E|nr:SDR family oxidoreductase [Actinokineospora spheciospongiae]PWW61887.1 NADP-dependent 3-hydroxy acid dehydrogenase YdfG [Actinokineospora spheciospongiae]
MTARPLALVTGASRGIGAAIARALAPDHSLLLGGRDVDTLHAAADRLPDARAWPVELTDPTALAAATSGIPALDVLVHSAGTAEVGPLTEATAERWRATFELNVVAVAELTRLLLPALRQARGHVVLINSGQGRAASPGWGPYAASKFALRAYADVLRGEEQTSGLRVTTVYPGRTDTDMQKAVRRDEGGDYRPEDYLTPDSVAKAVRAAVTADPDAHLTEVIIRPR